jgi:glutamate synthase (ferredoxin)
MGVIDINQANVACKGRLEPGKMLLIDTEARRIISDDEIKARLPGCIPTRNGNGQHIVDLDDMPAAPAAEETDKTYLIEQQKAFGYTFEDIYQTYSPWRLRSRSGRLDGDGLPAGSSV